MVLAMAGYGNLRISCLSDIFRNKSCSSSPAMNSRLVDTVPSTSENQSLEMASDKLEASNRVKQSSGALTSPELSAMITVKRMTIHKFDMQV